MRIKEDVMSLRQVVSQENLFSVLEREDWKLFANLNLLISKWEG